MHLYMGTYIQIVIYYPQRWPWPLLQGPLSLRLVSTRDRKQSDDQFKIFNLGSNLFYE